MTRQRYSTKEALNRILRIFQGKTEPDEAPGAVTGELLSENQAMSDYAELIDNSLPGETFAFPTSMDSSTTKRGTLETATNAEALAGTDTARAVTPAGLAAHLNANIGGTAEYGEIYNNSTGTVVVVTSTSWAKITGSFSADALSSDNIAPDWANDKVTINKVGIYFVGLQMSFDGSANSIANVAVYLDGVRQEQLRFRRQLDGDVESDSAIGIITVTGTSMDLEVYARADVGTPNFTLQAGQLMVYGNP